MRPLNTLRPEQLRAVYAIASAVLAFGIVAALMWDRSFFTTFDARHQTMPWLQKAARSWSAGHVPLWDANTASGRSFAGEFQGSAFYPVQLLWFSCFATTRGISLTLAEYLTVIHFAIAAAGMYLVLAHLTLDPIPALCGTMTFTILGALAARAPAQSPIFFGLALAPWAMWPALRYRDGGGMGWAAGAGAALGLQVLAGHGQPAIHTAMLVAAASCAGVVDKVRQSWPARDPLIRISRGFAVAGVSALIVSGPQLLLSAQYLQDAYRWVGAEKPITVGQSVPYAVYAYRAMLEPHDFLSLLDPWGVRPDDGNTLYFGTFPVVAVVGTVVAFRKLNVPGLRRERTWFAGIAAFTILAILGHNTPLAAVLRVTPVLGQVRELGRYLILLHFITATLTAMAIQAWRDAPLDLRLPRRALAAVILVSTLVLTYMWRWETGLSEIAIVQLALAIALAMLVACWSRARAALPWMALVLVLVHAIAFWNTLEIEPPPRGVMASYDTGTLAPKLRALYSHARVLVEEDPHLSANVADVVNFESKMAFGATLYRPYFDFLNTGWDLDSDVNDLLNVGYVLSRTQHPLKIVAQDPALKLTLYERSRYYPRVFLSSQLGRPGAGLADEIGLEVLEYSDEIQRFRLRAPADDIAIASEVAYPGWCARVNDKPTAVSKASINGKPPLFRALRVRAGVNEIEFRFRPWWNMIFGCP